MGGRKKGKGKTDDGWAPRDDRTGEIVTSNAKMEAYYKAQHILASEEEHETMYAAFRRDLPTTFRVNGSRPLAQDLQETIKTEYVPFLNAIKLESEVTPSLEPVTWYPKHYAWSIKIARKLLRKTPEYKKFQHFLVYETEAGNITRQEAVSMIPPLFLDVRKSDWVLDACAAPGSKTSQILEALSGSDAPSGSKEGLLVANDSDAKRCHMLIHQTLHRLGFPSCMIVNNDARHLPTFWLPSEPGSAKAKQPLLYDRILCDVPCSGDGTLRKNVAIWSKWSPSDAIGLHAMQLRILERCIQLLKPGGRLVYSTCSMNPIENEAVVGAALAANRNLHLVDASSHLPELKRSPGLTTWRVLDKNMHEHPTASPSLPFLPQTMWPTGEALDLERCMRFYPHVQDTGAFFVAVLEKIAKEVPLPVATAQENAPAKRKPSQEPVERAPAPKKVKGGRGVLKEEPFNYVQTDHPALGSLKSFLGIREDFPMQNLLVRNATGEPQRTLTLTSNIIRTILTHNSPETLRLKSCGVRLLSRTESSKLKDYKSMWRFTTEGIDVLRPYLTAERIVTGTIDDLRTLIGPEPSPTLSALNDSALARALDPLEPGTLLLLADIPRKAQQLALPMWLARVSCNLLLDKTDRSALSLRLFGEDLSPK
ncbi:hypothetical protein E5Q_04207 [Mixia osmundae IAM 14324]|uniref:SAM-dependent MTase RsmB/NOP-type domain-containing protein n=1 Tax=Mixia osmundae (strain CBS 9802 / IAM 14324 / JCM 22182 / KY 12970) TaxID=764103 RepID=G7E3W9_MIXOS|nr:hypothetical protein E5Q_04207 [Mixia osmundae IAM 14324]